MKMHILVDSREQALPGALINLGWKVKQKTMKTGDAFFSSPNGCILFERKEAKQFLIDWRSGQLNDQIFRMLRSARKKKNVVCCIIVEYGNDDVMEADLIDKHLQTLSFWVATATSNMIEGTAKQIDRFCKKMGNGELRDFKPPRVVHTTATIPQIAVLASMPGIGVERAERILREFRTLEEAFKRVERWTDIEGIGEGTVEKAVRTYTMKVSLPEEFK